MQYACQDQLVHVYPYVIDSLIGVDVNSAVVRVPTVPEELVRELITYTDKTPVRGWFMRNGKSKKY